MSSSWIFLIGKSHGCLSNVAKTYLKLENIKIELHSNSILKKVKFQNRDTVLNRLNTRTLCWTVSEHAKETRPWGLDSHHLVSTLYWNARNKFDFEKIQLQPKAIRDGATVFSGRVPALHSSSKKKKKDFAESILSGVHLLQQCHVFCLAAMLFRELFTFSFACLSPDQFLYT